MSKKDKKKKQMNKAKKELLKRANKTEEESPSKEESSKPEINNSNGDDSENFDYNPEYTPGEITKRSIVKEMKSDYLDYSMSVIVSRALPDVRDGLKPSQRRILVSMNDLHLDSKAHYRKSAKIAGDTSGNYHPHGETVVYPTMVKLAQDFATRYPLVDGQGNFGSIDGDSPAAMRYTEARMSKITMKLIDNLDKSTVTYAQNYDATRTEPTVLPALFPNLICNGGDGIAVGMATKIPPHNLTEIVAALRSMIKKGNKWEGTAIYNELRKKKEKGEKIPKVINNKPEKLFENYIDAEDPEFENKAQKIKDLLKDEETNLYPKFESNMTAEDLIEIVPGPDFPTGGIIYNQKETLKAYSTGRGRILMRAKAKIEEAKRGKYKIIVTEVPYQVNKAKMIKKIADLVKDGKIDSISNIRDESNRQGLRVVVFIKRNAQPKVVLNKLFKYTSMQKAFNANMIALVNGQPQTLNLKNILELFLSHRIEITIRKYEFELAADRYRNHILEGYLKALDLIEEVIKTIRGSKTQDEARENLIKNFDFTVVQAQAILDMQLRRLAALEKQKIEDEHKDLKKEIEKIENILSSQAEILKVVDTDLKTLVDKYGDERRTKVIKGKPDEISKEDMIAEEDTFVTISNDGYIKRVAPDVYRTQKRGGKGVVGATTKENDFIEHALMCSTHEELLLFTNTGKVYSLKVHQIPEYKRTAKGIPLVNLVQLDQDEVITSVLKHGNGVEDDIKKREKNKYLLMATEHGYVKKTKIEEFENIRNSGLIAINLEDGDKLGWVKATTGESKIMLITKKGKSIKFDENDVRDTGRNTKGVIGIKFKKDGDKVISMIKPQNEKKDKLFVISEKGYGKMTEISKYSTQNRGGTGVYTFRMKSTDKTGELVTAKIINKEIDEIAVISRNGVVIRLETKDIPKLGRQTSGVRIMRLKGKDNVTAVVLIKDDEE